MPDNERHDWDYTRDARELFGESYSQRRLIARDSPIRGGVYYGEYGGEAIVVDPNKYPKTYEHWYNLAKDTASENGAVKRGKVLESVFDTVTEQMPYSQEGVDRLLLDIAHDTGRYEFKDGTKVELASFMNQHVGVCRHQALVVGALLETFKDEGYIRGQVSIDRNTRWSPNGDSDGHAWARYTSNSGEVMILDVAQRYFGNLKDSPRDAQWNYLRPEERSRTARPNLGNIAILSSRE
jgi:hypothetical protein